MGNKLTCVVVDDEPVARRGLVHMLTAYPGVEVVGEANSIGSWVDLHSKLKPDLAFLDLMLRDKNILDFMDAELEGTQIVITTAYPQYALKGYEFNAIDYLLKPISAEDLDRSMRRVVRQSSRENPAEDTMYLRVNGKYHRIAYGDILYIQGMENYVVIHCENQRLIAKGTMIWFEKNLPEKDFIRVHKSYIVNKKKVDVIDKLTLMVREQFIPISRENRNAVYNSLMNG